MASFNRSLKVPYTARQMFDLVDRIEDYPEFLPWCQSAKAERGEGKEVLATLGLRRGSLGHSFTTRNVHDPENLMIKVRLARGPLSFLSGEWRFVDKREAGCLVEFQIDYQFANRILDKLLSPMFAAVYERMIDAFAHRADEVYGKKQ